MSILILCWNMLWDRKEQFTMQYVYNSEGQVEYGEIIREIDDFVLSRVYLDGTSEDFEPPQLTDTSKSGSLQKIS